jgi:hypothetical protein
LLTFIQGKFEPQDSGQPFVYHHLHLVKSERVVELSDKKDNDGTKGTKDLGVDIDADGTVHSIVYGWDPARPDQLVELNPAARQKYRRRGRSSTTTAKQVIGPSKSPDEIDDKIKMILTEKKPVEVAGATVAGAGPLKDILR